MATATEYAARLDAVANEIAADLDELRQELANSSAEESARWSAALDGPIARLEGLGTDENDPEPSAPAESQDPAQNGESV